MLSLGLHISYYFTGKRNLEKNIANKRFQYFSIFSTLMKYLPATSLWINKLFIELANNSENACLMIDCSGVNKNGPGMFRT